MPESVTQLETTNLPGHDDRGREEKTRLLTLDHLDGRTLAVRQVRITETEIVKDLGGTAHVSQAQRALCRRAAVLATILEDAEARWASGQHLDLSTYLPAVNVLRRCLATIGLERKARSVHGLPPLLARDD